MPPPDILPPSQAPIVLPHQEKPPFQQQPPPMSKEEEPGYVDPSKVPSSARATGAIQTPPPGTVRGPDGTWLKIENRPYASSQRSHGKSQQFLSLLGGYGEPVSSQPPQGKNQQFLSLLKDD